MISLHLLPSHGLAQDRTHVRVVCARVTPRDSEVDLEVAVDLVATVGLVIAVFLVAAAGPAVDLSRGRGRGP